MSNESIQVCYSPCYLVIEMTKKKTTFSELIIEMKSRVQSEEMLTNRKKLSRTSFWSGSFIMTPKW